MKQRLDIVNLVPMKGIFVEVGTLSGKFAHEIALKRPDLKLKVVDNWMPPHQYEKSSAYGLLRDKAEILEMDSLSASNLFDDNSVDLVYLDADHTYQGVLKDLQAWWPKVKRGGYIASHDFENKPKGDWHTEIAVKDAVTDWANEIDVIIKVIDEPAPTCYIRKP